MQIKKSKPFDLLFHRKEDFPSSYFMLYAHSLYPKQVKFQYWKKVKDRFGVRFLGEPAEASDKSEVVKLLAHISRQISTMAYFLLDKTE